MVKGRQTLLLMYYYLGSAPPERPILSGSGSIMENPGHYVSHHIKDLSTKHDSYIQDTPDFVRNIEKINSDIVLTYNTVTVKLNVIL